MSVWATTWAYEQTVKPVGRKFVLVCLANYADENGYCFPSQQTLATMTDQGVSTVREHLKSLEIEGFIDREHRYLKKDRGGRTSDGFYLQAPPDRLKPTVKGLPPKVSAKRRLTAEPAGTYRQVSGDLPPKAGYDPLDDPSVSDPSVKEMSPAERVFQCWKEAMEHPKARLDAKRKDVISRRLTDGYSVDDLCIAIRGCGESDFHMGKNDRNTKYNDITLICRDAKHVDQFIEIAQGANGFQLRPSGMNSAQVEAMLHG